MKDAAFFDGHGWGIGCYVYTDEAGERHSGYGIGVRPKNPHDFSPDFDSCHEDEIAAWKYACEKWDREHGAQP